MTGTIQHVVKLVLKLPVLLGILMVKEKVASAPSTYPSVACTYRRTQAWCARCPVTFRHSREPWSDPRPRRHGPKRRARAPWPRSEGSTETRSGTCPVALADRKSSCRGSRWRSGPRGAEVCHLGFLVGNEGMVIEPDLPESVSAVR
jgi:hypothetical protein